MICDVVVEENLDKIWAPIFPGSLKGRPNYRHYQYLIWISVQDPKPVPEIRAGMLLFTRGPEHVNTGDVVTLPETWIIA